MTYAWRCRCGAPGELNSSATATMTPQTDGRGNAIRALSRDRDGNQLRGVEIICTKSKKVEWMCPLGKPRND